MAFFVKEPSYTCKKAFTHISPLQKSPHTHRALFSEAGIDFFFFGYFNFGSLLLQLSPYIYIYIYLITYM